jgi:hypothetical protein
MATAKLLNLIAVSTLAILAASFGATPVTAVSVDTTHLGARSHAHAALAKKRRGNGSKRCKPRSTTSPAAATKPTTTTTPAPAKTTSKAAAATTSKASSGSGSSSSGSSSGTNTSGSSGLGKGKASLAWGVNDNTALKNMANGGKVGALYTWAPWIPDITKSLNIRPCPMLWGEKQIGQFTSTVKEGYADCVLGFNEPNQAGQSDMDPAYAAQLWKQYIQPLKAKGYTLVSPAPTNAPSGKVWLQNFLKACNGGCHLDAIAVHFYGTDPEAMKSYLTDMHNTFGINIWPTEFACQNFGGGAQCSKDQVWSFFQTIKPWMDSQNWIDYYFAFGAMYDLGNVNPLNALLGGNKYPTDLGYFYLN